MSKKLKTGSFNPGLPYLADLNKYRLNQCKECEAVYVGEKERSLKARFQRHQQPSSTTSEARKHMLIIPIILRSWKTQKF